MTTKYVLLDGHSWYLVLQWLILRKQLGCRFIGKPAAQHASWKESGTSTFKIDHTHIRRHSAIAMIDIDLYI